MKSRYLCCPVCRGELNKNENSYTCERGHSYDIAKQGYINLLMSSKGSTHGDNNQMTDARQRFLSGGFYSPLADEICKNAAEHFSDGGVLIDCGCGECYYTDRVYSALREKFSDIEVCGFDISRDAIKQGAKRNKSITLLVAGVYNMPFLCESADMLLSVFSPFAREEFLRVLKKGGVLISVIPDKKHLWSLKSALYETPYENVLDDYEIEGFEFVGKSEVKNNVTLQNGQIADLFMMTPYYYRTKPSDKEKILSLEEMTVETEFQVLVYKKIF